MLFYSMTESTYMYIQLLHDHLSTFEPKYFVDYSFQLSVLLLFYYFSPLCGNLLYAHIKMLKHVKLRNKEIQTTVNILRLAVYSL